MTLPPDAVPAGARPLVRHEELRPRIAHLGVGAFHRAHQAVYTEVADAATGADWGIVGVERRASATARALRAQDGYYSVTTLTPQGPQTRVVGSILGVLDVADQREEVMALLTAPSTSVITLTVTEKGYLRTVEGGLDEAAVADELASGEPLSTIGLLATALADRARGHRAAVTVLSCDNMAGNGPALSRVVTDYVRLADWPDAEGVLAWIATDVAFPATIVDRIVPATTPEDLAVAERALGVRDDAAVVGEPYLQWVIEDSFAGQRPPWDAAGAVFVPDVAPYQLTKLRLLNGAHSLLAYLGLASGCATVAEAMGTDWGERVVLDLAAEVAPVLPAGGPDAGEYARSLVERFDNPAIHHRLTQIGSDGSLKLPERWLGSLRDLRALGSTSPTILRGLGAWVAAIRPEDDAGDDLATGRQVWGTTDPRAAALAECWTGAPDHRGVVVAALTALGAVDLAVDPDVVAEVTVALEAALAASEAQRA